MDTNYLSYIVGLFQTDGHLYETSRNRGKLTIELSFKDLDIIKKISKNLEVNYSIKERIRNTNYKKKYKSVILTISDLHFRNKIKDWGMISGKKSEKISVPNKNELNKFEYIRGLYDGDGSIGFTSKNFPFVSFTTQSEEIKDFLINFIQEITDKPRKEIKRNSRDNIYNISIYKEDAVVFCEKIYTKNCLSINRKYILSQNIKKWKRPDNMKKIIRKNWTKEEDSFIMSHTIKESCEKLNRTVNSVKNRLRRIKSK